MLGYLAGRIARGVVVLAGLSVVIFAIARIVPGDPARIVLGPLATAEQVVALRHTMGLDRPLAVQYGRYVGDLLRGDLGQSILTQRSVNEDLADAFPATLELMLSSLLLVLVVAIPGGALAARHRGGWIDGLSRLMSLLGVVTPSFVIAICLQILAGYVLHMLPISGRLDPNIDFRADITGFMTIDSLLAGRPAVCLDALLHLVLPTLALAAATAGQIMRFTRSSMIEVSRRDYVEAARAFGAPDRAVIFKYMLKPAIVPTLTILGLEFASLLGNAFVVEMVFGLPGIASYGVRAILHKDLNGLMGVVMVTGLLFVTVNLLVDIAVALVDPRVRLGAARA
jgi:peptide/nickel transport system permease protein